MTTSVTTFAELEKLKNDKPIALNFHADWCEPCTAMNAVFATLASQHGAAMQFVQVDADKGEELVERFGVGAVPTYIVLTPTLTVATRVEGADAARVTEAVRSHAGAADSTTTATVPAAVVSIEDRLRALINKAPVMLFMKGSPQEPKCGFSSKIVALLHKYPDVQFGSFDILQDMEVRNELKKFSNWPTYPQLYAAGSLLGGIDVANELDEEGELHTVLLKAIKDAKQAAN